MPQNPLPAPSRRRFLQIAGTTMLVTGAGVFSLRSARAGTGSRLHVLHINDMHSRLEAISGSDATCSPTGVEEGTCFGGAPRLAQAIRDRRDALAAEDVPVLTLDAGDQSQGTLFYTTYRGKAEVEMMNMIGFDAMTLGNHEFNNGPDSLAEMLAEAQFPIVAGNVIVPEDHALAPLVQDHLILEARGERIGVLGVTTPDTIFLSSPGPVTFRDEIEHLNEAVAQLRGEGVNRIILLSHVGFRRDQEIAAAVEGLSLIIGGHSHTLLSNTVEGAPAYATMVEAPDGRPGAHRAGLCLLALPGRPGAGVRRGRRGDRGRGRHDPAGCRLPRGRGRGRAGGGAGRAHRGPEAHRDRRDRRPIDGSRESCRAMECEMGNAVTNAMLARVGDPSITLALTNGGGLRASLEAGMVTVGDVLTVLPFQNTLVTMQLPGAALVAALEHGVGGIEDGAGRFPQVAGMRFRLDTSVAPGEGRVSEVEVETAEGWAPIDESAMYGLVTNNFMARGGDGYEVLAEEGRRSTTPPSTWPTRWPSTCGERPLYPGDRGADRAIDEDRTQIHHRGQDAYAAIEFTTTVSEIRNPDGTVVFRNDAVEVPAGWSQVASDVLAQKYFRKAGVAARLKRVKEKGVPEFLWRSVPDEAALAGCPRMSAWAARPRRGQVFDRLAGAWAYWGWKGGYFTTEADARAYFDEMRYMLAAQMAAPNSPQWFNTGLHWAYGIDGPARGISTSTPRPASW
jgi:5'-nucleotidase / UDP-sugar diphosphatase